MKRPFGKLRHFLHHCMDQCYGHDALGTFLILAGLLFLFTGLIPGLHYMMIASFLVIIWSCFRCFSHNIPARQKELDTFRNIPLHFKRAAELLPDIWRDRKTHTYFKCKHCGAVLRVPKHQGNIEGNCPRCGSHFTKKT